MDLNELKVSEAFTKQSVVFDDLNEANQLTVYFRNIYRKEVDFNIKDHSQILELNCGTGLDAVYFAGKGHNILATDVSEGMLRELDKKVQQQQLQDRIQTLLLSYNELYKLNGTKFDYVISNFGGLNCTDQLDNVLSQLAPLLNKGGKITLAIMPRVCPWELLMALKGKFRTAFRRFRKKTPAHIEGEHFYCYYYNPRYVMSTLKSDFRLVGLKGVFITTPPEFIQHFVERHPRLFSVLTSIDRKICTIFPFTQWCDHYIITLEKNKE